MTEAGDGGFCRPLCNRQEVSMSFKTCSCGKQWNSRDTFLADPTIKLVGYQVDFEDLKEGFFLFNHLLGVCRTTLSVSAGHFIDLYEGPVFQERLFSTQSCPGHCLRREDLNPCLSKCECAFVRQVLHSVSRWPKQVPSD